MIEYKILTAAYVYGLLGLGLFFQGILPPGDYDIDGVMALTASIACVVGSSTQISHKSLEYHIQLKEAVAIFLTGFIFAYFSYIIGESFHSKGAPHIKEYISPVHIAGLSSVILSYFSIEFLKALKKSFLYILQGVSKGVPDVLLESLRYFLRAKK